MLLIPIAISTASTVALNNSFPPGAFPKYRLDCTQLSNGTWHCSPVEQQCDSFVELGVVCKNYKNEYLKNCTYKLPETTTTTQEGKLINARDYNHNTYSTCTSQVYSYYI